MKIVGVVGSQRLEGNNEIVVRTILEGARSEGAETELLRLAERNIGRCLSFHLCVKKGICPINDDFALVRDILLSSDGLVLASPTQALTISGTMKNLVERLMSEVFLQSFAGKYVVTVSIGGMYGMNKTIKYLKDTALAMGMWNVGSLSGMAWTKGDIQREEKVLRRAEEVGRKLAKTIREKRGYPFQRFIQKIGPLRLFKSFIKGNRDELAYVYRKWEEKGWL